MVKFLIECRTSAGRLGQISEWGSFNINEEKFHHVTPSFLLYTRLGHIPHLTWDVATKFLKFTQDPILQLTLPSL